MTSPVIVNRQHFNLRTVSQYCVAYRDFIGYFIGGLAASFAFVGVCLMSGDSKIRQQQLRISQYQNDDYMADLNGLRVRHDMITDLTQSLLLRPVPCKESILDIRRLHTEMDTILHLALPSFALAGSQWARQHYFEDSVAQPLMSLFLISTAAGVTCLLIALISSVDNASIAARKSYFHIPRKPPEPAKSFPDPANPPAERIPRCYKLQELESDLESITRLELDDQEGGNHYVYGPWRVYCESRDGNEIK